jgi:hypothetical protein
MKKNILGLLGVISIGFVYIACTSVVSVESSFAFPTPVPVNNLIIGSFTYNINDSYAKLPNGTLVLLSTINEKSNPEIYDEETYMVNSGGGDKIEKTRYNLKDNIIASYNELYSWAIQSIAKSEGITQILAIKSFIKTTTTSAGDFKNAQQEITITVYGERIDN